MGANADEVFEAVPYRLCTAVLHAGTRSEGRIGRLFLNGEEVTGHRVGSTVDVPTASGPVRFTYLGEQRPHLWSRSGWTVAMAPTSDR